MSNQKFNVKVLVQGVGVYVPHTDGKSLLVLFPDQDRAYARGIRTFNNEEICDHYAVAQFDERNLDATAAETWSSMDLTGCWVKISSDSKVPLGWKGANIEGLPVLEEVLHAAGVDASFADVDRRALPGPEFDPSLLKAGLLLQRGKASPDNDWAGPFDFFYRDAEGERQIEVGGNYANVIQFELRQVSRFELVLKPFSGGPERKVALRPVGIGDVLEVWIRHFCDISKPDPDKFRPKASEPDSDFALNYALSNNLDQLLPPPQRSLPFPRVDASWVGGIGIGGNPNKCMSSKARAADFPTDL